MKNLHWLILLVLMGCNAAGNKLRVHISLVNQKTALQITGIDKVIMADINRDSAANWQALFPVYRMPVDTEMKDLQPEQPGKYQLNDSVLVFTPDTAFAPGQTYFMRYYNFGSGKSVLDYIKVKAKPNASPYTDLIFKQ